MKLPKIQLFWGSGPGASGLFLIVMRDEPPGRHELVITTRVYTLLLIPNIFNLL